MTEFDTKTRDELVTTIERLQGELKECRESKDIFSKLYVEECNKTKRLKEVIHAITEKL